MGSRKDMTNTALALRRTTALLPLGGSLDAYISAVNAIELIDATEEKRLAEQLHDHQDHEAAQKLVLSNLRCVVHIARGYRRYDLPFGDRTQEGNIGRMKAVKRFDPTKGMRLIS